MVQKSENLQYDEKIEQEVFKEILDTLTFIETIFISREKFNKLKWNFLVELSWEEKKNFTDKTDDRWQHVFRKDYRLFLPKDLEQTEFPSIILKVNKLTFWEVLPKYASTRELQVKIIIAFEILLDENKKLKNNTKKSKKIQRAIWKYTQVYEGLWFDIKDLNSVEKRKDILKQFDNEKIKEYEKELIKWKTQIQLTELKDELGDTEGGNIHYDEYLNKQLNQHFLESFFEMWVNNLGFWLELMTKWEQALVDKRIEEDNDWEIIKLHQEINKMVEEERLLRDKINIEKYKSELKELRKNWNIEEIAKKELEATNVIIKSLHNNFPYQLTREWYWGNPSKMQLSKELFCVWYSIVWHSFLSELWIQHKWLHIPGHSALEVNIWWKNYYFDAVGSWKIWEFEYWKDVGSYTQMKTMWWNRTNDEWKVVEILFQSWDVEKVLASQVYNNRWNFLYRWGKYKEAIKMYDKAIKLSFNSANFYNNIWVSLYELIKYDQAIDAYNKAIKLNPNTTDAYYNKGNLLYELKKYQEAVEVYNKVLELNPTNDKIYNKLGRIFSRLEHYEEALAMNRKAIDIEKSKDKYYYDRAWIYSLSNNVRGVMKNLDFILKKGFFKVASNREVFYNDWNFNNVKETNVFKEFVNKLKKEYDD